MFDLGWTECLFLAMLAIIVVGPRDLPKLARLVGNIVGKGRRVYRDAMSSIHRLEQEIDIASKPEGAADNSHFDLLPDDVKQAMRMDSPHRDSEQHQRAEAAHQQAMEKIRLDHRAQFESSGSSASRSCSLEQQDKRDEHRD